MTEYDFDGCWNYFLSLEQDLLTTARYVEPRGQENVYSFEFAKILILTCTELESVFRIICEVKCPDKSAKGMNDYCNIILNEYPRIVETEVYINRLGISIKPLENLGRKTSWWDAYNGVKHNRKNEFSKASYINVVYALASLYIALLYLGNILKCEFNSTETVCLSSSYCGKYLLCAPPHKLPDFQ